MMKKLMLIEKIEPVFFHHSNFVAVIGNLFFRFSSLGNLHIFLSMHGGKQLSWEGPLTNAFCNQCKGMGFLCSLLKIEKVIGCKKLLVVSLESVINIENDFVHLGYIF